jgi:hypothetical protein
MCTRICKCLHARSYHNRNCIVHIKPSCFSIPPPRTPGPETPTECITPVSHRRSLIHPQNNSHMVSPLLIQSCRSETGWSTASSGLVEYNPPIIRHAVIHSRGRVDYTRAFTTPIKDELSPNTILHFIRKSNQMHEQKEQNLVDECF